jgi:hypothetical protein
VSLGFGHLRDDRTAVLPPEVRTEVASDFD